MGWSLFQWTDYIRATPDLLATIYLSPFVVMLMQFFELRNLGRIEKRFDLLVCALHQRLHLLMFLIFAQAGILVDRFELRISGNQNRPDLSLLGVAEAELGGQPGQLLLGAEVMFALSVTGPGTGRRVGGRR